MQNSFSLNKIKFEICWNLSYCQYFFNNSYKNNQCKNSIFYWKYFCCDFVSNLKAFLFLQNKVYYSFYWHFLCFIEQHILAKQSRLAQQPQKLTNRPPAWNTNTSNSLVACMNKSYIANKEVLKDPASLKSNHFCRIWTLTSWKFNEPLTVSHIEIVGYNFTFCNQSFFR